MLIEFCAEQDEAFEHITCSAVYLAEQSDMVDQVLTSRRVNADSLVALDTFEASLLIDYVQRAGLVVCRQWVADDKKIAPERLADLACELICRGTEGFLRSANGQALFTSR